MRKLLSFYFVLLLAAALAAQTAGSRRIPDDNLAYPVSISFGSSVTGSGFYLNTGKTVFLVTAKHVLFEADGRTLRGQEADVTSYGRDPQDQTPALFHLNFGVIANNDGLRPHDGQDVVVVKVGTVEGTSGQFQFSSSRGVTVRGVPPSGIVSVAMANVKRFADVFVSNEIVVFGYPNSIGLRNAPQIDYTRPLLRRGIVAGKNEALKTIVLDCPVYPGNSGGPVLELAPVGLNTQLRVIGVVVQYVPIVQDVVGPRGAPPSAVLGNSGYAIATAMDSVLELVQRP